jgi:6-phosphogluconate dehydrogenase
MKQQFDFGMVGLGVMGRNLLLNMADKGFSTIGYDLDKEKCAHLEREASVNPAAVVKGVNSIEEMVNLLSIPRKILLLVPAGKPVDNVIEELLPILDSGDVIIDGGNSFFKDTDRRIEYLNGNGIHFMGMGVSGGEQGARIGPSMMPGGDMLAFDKVKPMLEAVAAKANGIPCFAYMGKGAAGHFVKMVHNGIEYAMMQMISEAYDLLKRAAGFSNDEMHVLFSEWNQGKLQSFLIEITASVLKNKDASTGAYVTDIILDKAGSKGTGKWTTQEALNVQAAIPTIDAAVAARTISGYTEEWVKAAALYPHSKEKSLVPKQTLAEDLQRALSVGFIMAYVQGFDMIEKASQEYDMEIDAGAVLQVWKAGCIIRSGLLANFQKAYAADPLLGHLLLDKQIAGMVQQDDCCARRVINIALSQKIPVPAFMSAVAYLDAFTTGRLPTNLIQALRDFFGAHTYERIDQPGVFHTEWES